MLECLTCYGRLSKRVLRFTSTSRNHIHTFKSQIFRLVHPDLYNNESQQVQDINLKCLQNLSEFYDTWNAASKQLIGSAGDYSSSIHFNSEYDFSCYVRLKPTSSVPNDSSSKTATAVGNGVCLSDIKPVASSTATSSKELTVDLLFSPYILRPATTITSNFKKQCNYLSKQEAEYEMNALKNDFICFAQNLGISVDGSVEQLNNSKPSSDGMRRIDKTDTKNYIKNSQDVNIRLETLKFERIMATSYNRSFTSMFPTKTNMSKAKKDKFLLTEIDYYLQNGHIYVEQLSAHEEFEVLSRFRDFIFRYAEMVYFTSSNWQKMVFVFYNDSPSFEYDERTKGIQMSRAKYSCEYKTDMFVFKIPYKFKNKKLIMLVTDHIERIISY